MKQEEPKKVLTEKDIFSQRDIDAVTNYIGKETSKQETLEEAFEKNAQYLDDFENKNTYEYGFKDGAKWQQERMYSEEDVKTAFLDGWQLRDGNLPFPKAKKKWFNEFKNKLINGNQL